MKATAGLDMLIVAEEKYLRGVKYKNFHIRHITELLRASIIDSFATESFGCESHHIDFYYEHTFPYYFAQAVMLVAECFTEYRQKGKYALRDYETDENRRIAAFVYNGEVLETLRAELQSALEPKHSLYESWKNSEHFNEWQAHIKMLCETLTQAISEGGGDNG
jgi:hypothetical protein